MNQKNKILSVVTMGLAATAAFTGDAQAAQPHSVNDLRASERNDALQTSANEFEASFLKVSESCKVSHRSFEPMKIALENVSMDIRQIHAEIESA